VLPVAFPASSRSHGVDRHETSVLRVANETPLPDRASSRAHHRRWQNPHQRFATRNWPARGRL